MIHIHTGEELKTQSDIITTSCFFSLPRLPEIEYFRRLVDDESVGFGPMLHFNHNKTISLRSAPARLEHRKAWPNMAEILLHGLAQWRCEWPQSLLVFCVANGITWHNIKKFQTVGMYLFLETVIDISAIWLKTIHKLEYSNTQYSLLKISKLYCTA